MRAIVAIATLGYMLSPAIGQCQTRPVTGAEANRITTLLRNATAIRPVTATSTPTGNCVSSQLADGTRIATQSIDAAKPVYDPIAANSQASVLWPGSLIQLAPFTSSGVLSGVPVARTGGKVLLTSLAATVDPATGRGVSVAAVIPQFGAAAVETARIDHLSNPAIAGIAQFTTGFATFSSLNEMAFRFNGSASAFGASFSAQLNSSEYSQQNNEAILLWQPIYTYAAEDLQGVSAFAEGVTADTLSAYTNASNPIGYVSSVTYGRAAVMTFSSSLDKSELDDLVRASASFLAGQVNAETERRVRRAVTQTTIHLWLYGFPMTSNAILGSQDVMAALKAAMADHGPLVLRSALPISFRANYLYNDQAAAINLTTSFSTSTRSGAPLVQSIKVHFRMGNDGGDNKDWDTGLSINLIDRVNSFAAALGGNVRARATVPRGVNGEGSWQSGRDDIEVPLTIVGTLKWSELNTLTLIIAEDTGGGADHIAFTPTVIAYGPSGAIYKATLPGMAMPLSNVPGFPLFPGDMKDVTTQVPTLPAPTCEAPANMLRTNRATSAR